MTLPDHPPTLGLVLAGGLARRMGGGDKALLRVGGRPLLERARDCLTVACAEVILSANGDAARFAAFGLPVLSDDVPGFAGPLAGVLAGLDWAATCRPAIAWVASAPADCPFLPDDLVPRLHRAARASALPLACAWSAGRAHPVVGLWSVALRHDLRRALVQEGLRKIDTWTARHGIAAVEWPTQPRDPFFNVNTRADLAAAERIAAAQAES